MTKALGYSKLTKQTHKTYPQWNTKNPKRKEKDPDAMDVDQAQLLPQEKE
jgi:hypothetical protein